MAALGSTGAHHDILGITGALAVLIAVLAGVLAGPWTGGLSAAVGGIAFFVLVSDVGRTAPATATLAATAVWCLAAVITGIVADRLRSQQAARRGAEEAAAILHAELESRLLPRLEHSYGELSLLWRYVPSEDRLRISGDFYDAAQTQDGRLAVVMGDVVGHGPDAAALGATLRASWHALVRSAASDAQVVTTLNGVLARESPSPDAFATLCLARFEADGCRVSLLLLGHPAPLLLTDYGVKPLDVRPEPPLGLAEAAACVPTAISLPAAYDLLFYTDGLVEGHSSPASDHRFGLERLMAELRRGAAAGGLDDRALDAVLAAVTSANGGPLPDDAAVLSVSRRAAEATAPLRSAHVTAGATDAAERAPAAAHGARRTAARPVTCRLDGDGMWFR